MNRRQFLTITTAAAITGLARLAAPPTAAAKGLLPVLRQTTLYQGTKDGKLFESTDGGKSWQLIANFGSHCVVEQIVSPRDGGVSIRLNCSGYSFDLLSKDARVWRTA